METPRAPAPSAPPLRLRISAVSGLLTGPAPGANITPETPGTGLPGEHNVAASPSTSETPNPIMAFKKSFYLLIYQISGNIGRNVKKVKARVHQTQATSPQVQQPIEEGEETHEIEKCETDQVLSVEEDVLVCPLLGLDFKIELHNKKLLKSHVFGSPSAGRSLSQHSTTDIGPVAQVLISSTSPNFRLNEPMSWKMITNPLLLRKYPKFPKEIVLTLEFSAVSHPDITQLSSYHDIMESRKSNVLEIDPSTLLSTSDEYICYFEPDDKMKSAMEENNGSGLGVQHFIPPNTAGSYLRSVANSLPMNTPIQLSTPSDINKDRLQLQGLLIDGARGEVVEYCDTVLSEQLSMRHSGQTWVMTPGGYITQALVVHLLPPLFYRRTNLTEKIEDERESKKLEPSSDPLSPQDIEENSDTGEDAIRSPSSNGSERDTMLKTSLFSTLVSSPLHDIDQNFSIAKKRRKNRIKRFLGLAPMAVMNSSLNSKLIVRNINNDVTNNEESGNIETNAEKRSRNIAGNVGKSVLIIGALPTFATKLEEISGHLILARVVKDKVVDMLKMTKGEMPRYTVGEEGYKIDIVSSTEVYFNWNKQKEGGEEEEEEKKEAKIGICCVFDELTNKIFFSPLPDIRLLGTERISSLLEILPEIRTHLDFLQNNEKEESISIDVNIAKQSNPNNGESTSLDVPADIRMSSIPNFIPVPMRYLKSLGPKKQADAGSNSERLKSKKKKKKKTAKQPLADSPTPPLLTKTLMKIDTSLSKVTMRQGQEGDIKYRILWSGEYNYDLSATIFDESLNEINVCNSSRRFCNKNNEKNDCETNTLGTPRTTQQSNYIVHNGQTSVMRVCSETAKSQTLAFNFLLLPSDAKYIVPMISLSNDGRIDGVNNNNVLVVELLVGDRVISVRKLPVVKDAKLYIEHIFSKRERESTDNQATTATPRRTFGWYITPMSMVMSPPPSIRTISQVGCTLRDLSFQDII